MNLKRLKLNFHIPDINSSQQGKRKSRGGSGSSSVHHINPRFRAYGKARLDIASRVGSQEDWDELWKPSTNPFILKFPWGSAWKQCIEYYAADFAAEIGFWIDIIGLPVTALGPDYAQFTSPGGEITFAVASADPDDEGTPINAFRLQFYIDELQSTCEELRQRSVPFEQPPQQVSAESSLSIATFRTPHGIAVDLWSESPAVTPESKLQQQTEPIEVLTTDGAAGFNDDYTQIIQEEVDAPPIASSPGIENHTRKKDPSWQDFLTIPPGFSIPEQNPSNRASPDPLTPRQISTESEYSRHNWSANIPSFEEKTSKVQEPRSTYLEVPADLLDEDNAVEEEDEDDWDEDEEADDDEISDEIVYEALVDEEENEENHD